MSQRKSRRQRGSKKPRIRPDLEHQRIAGIEAFRNRTSLAEAKALVFERAFEQMYKDYGSVKPRMSKQAYLDQAIQELAKERKVMIVPQERPST